MFDLDAHIAALPQDQRERALAQVAAAEAMMAAERAEILRPRTPAELADTRRINARLRRRKFSLTPRSL